MRVATTREEQVELEACWSNRLPCWARHPSARPLSRCWCAPAAVEGANPRALNQAAMISSTVGRRARGGSGRAGGAGRDRLATMGRSQLGGCDGPEVLVMEHHCW
jgi:hypothetical protein